MGVVAGLCCLPILIWNAQHDWVTIRHVHTLGGGADTRIYWLGPLIYLAGQAGILLLIWFGIWLCAMTMHNPLREPRPEVRYLWWLSAPMFLVFLAFGFRTGGGEVNWPVTTYLSGLVLSIEWLTRQLASPRPWYRRWVIGNVALAVTLGLAMTLLMHHSEWFYPQLEKLVGASSDPKTCRIRRVDPTCRLRGWRTLAQEVERLRADLRSRGIEPVLACNHWSLAGELAVYCPDHPPVYSLGWVTGDRHSQYDFWPGPMHTPEAFAGRTFIVIGGLKQEILEQAFEGIEFNDFVVHREQNHPISAWIVTVCTGFKGSWPEPAKNQMHF
jgi:hypothetical protein